MKKKLKKIILILLVIGQVYSISSEETTIDTQNHEIPKVKDNMANFYFGFSPLLGYHYIAQSDGPESADGSNANVDLQIGIKLNKKFSIFISIEAMFFPMRLGPVGPTPFESPSSQMVYFVSDSYIERNNPAISSLASFPFGIIYNIIPENLFISFKLFFPMGAFDDYEFSADEVTFGFGAAIGKKWFISERWAIGIALNLQYQYLTPSNVSGEPFHDIMAGISTSISFN